MSSPDHDETVNGTPDESQPAVQPSTESTEDTFSSQEATAETYLNRATVLVAHLKEAREAKGLSPEELSDRTRISLHVVHSLEQADFSVVETPFVRAFLRTYAKAVGVPLEEVEDIFPEPKALVEDPIEGEDIHAIPIPRRPRLPWGVIFRSVVVLGAVLFVLWLKPWSPFINGSSSEADSTPATIHREFQDVPAISPVDSVSTPTVDSTQNSATVSANVEPVLCERKPPPPPPPTRSSTYTPPQVLSPPVRVADLKIVALDTVWVQILDEATEDVMYDATLPPGFSRKFTLRDTVQITFGRHWAVAMTLGGDSIAVPGLMGRDVSTFWFGPSGVIGR
jgi:cytoskeleton protein RodZ